MNESVITRELVGRGIPRYRIRYCNRPSVGMGPSIHIEGTDFFADLPIDDESDKAFADFVFKEVMSDQPYWAKNLTVKGEAG